MVNIYELICGTLAPLDYPVLAEGSELSDDIDNELPNTYITYMIYDDEPLLYADDEDVDVVYSLQINFYSKEPTIVQNARTSMWEKMREADFTKGHGRDLPYDKKSGHYGYTCDFEYF